MLYGTFKSINGNKYTVNINCDLNYEIGSDDRICFTSDPVEISQDLSDTFDHIIKTSCQINLLVKEYIGDKLFTANDREISVRILKDSECIFDGFVEPYTFNQDFAEKYTELTLNCQDFLCTLENHKYSERTAYDYLKTNATNRSFLYILNDIFGSGKDLYYDGSINVQYSGNNVFSYCGISELMFLGDEEDDLWTQEDILTEMLQYFNLHIVQIGSKFYIFNWERIKRTGKISWVHLSGSGSGTLETTIDTITVNDSLYKSDDTQISMSDVYNQIILECDLEEQEDVFESPLDSDSLVSPYTNKNKYMSEVKAGGQLRDWYFQYKVNPNWFLRYYANGTVKYVNDLIEYSENTAINQYKMVLCQFSGK